MKPVDKDRRPIPRWRFSQQSFHSIEFSGDPRIARATSIDERYLQQKCNAWEQAPSNATAIDLLICATNTLSAESAKNAAGFLVNHKTKHSPQVEELITRTQGPPQNLEEITSLVDRTHTAISIGLKDNARIAVSTARARLVNDPKNSIAWVDLSRAFTILGLNKKATRAMEIALSLSPFHRYVLRSATRFFLHIEQYDRARSLLTKNKRTPHDPWLTAAEISVAQIAEKDPRFTRAARSLIETSGLPPAQLSELRSAFGTLEFSHGAQRKARQQVRASLQSPTENAVAQARWIGTHLTGIEISPETYQLPKNYEARCWHAVAEDRWDDAASECIEWILDEPYSSRPALLGSFIGISILNDANFTMAFARAGLVSEPNNSMLKNNEIVGLAYGDQLEKAFDLYLGIPKPLPNDLAPYVYLATGGLLMFRAGDVAGGRKLYETAEAKAPKNRKLDVMLFRAREEIRLTTTGSEAWLEKALNHDIPKNSLFLGKFQSTLKLEANRKTPIFHFPDTGDIRKSLLNEVDFACKKLILKS